MKLKTLRVLLFLIKKSRLWRFNFIYSLVFKFNNAIPKPSWLTINGKKLFIYSRDDAVSCALYYNGQFEPVETSLFQTLVKKGDVVLDLGAHVGYYTLISSTLVGKRGKVFSFEPDPHNFALLQKSVTTNKLANVQLVNKAVSKENKTINFYLSNDNKGDNRIFMDNSKEKSIQVQSITLDKYFAKTNKQIDFIKMDIQGAEIYALQGMSEILRRNKDIILIFEFWPYGYSHAGANIKELSKCLNTNKFLPYQVDESAKRLIPTSVDLLLKDFHVNKNSDFTNILCIRNKARLTALL